MWPRADPALPSSNTSAASERCTEELGIEPEAETKELYAEIKRIFRGIRCSDCHGPIAGWPLLVLITL